MFFSPLGIPAQSRMTLPDVPWLRRMNGQIKPGQGLPRHQHRHICGLILADPFIWSPCFLRCVPCYVEGDMKHLWRRPGTRHSFNKSSIDSPNEFTAPTDPGTLEPLDCRSNKHCNHETLVMRSG